jgi:hypothetical protein
MLQMIQYLPDTLEKRMNLGNFHKNPKHLHITAVALENNSHRIYFVFRKLPTLPLLNVI